MMTDEEIYEALQSLDIEITPEKYDALLKVAKAELESRVIVPIEPTSYTQTMHDFKGDKIIVDMFPVESIHQLKINNTILYEDTDYQINYDDGIIYLKQPCWGFLKLEYIAGLSVNDYQKYITPLLLLILQDKLDVGWDKNASSISEGDISVSYDTSLGIVATIQKGVDDLNNRFSTYLRMI